MDIKNQLIWIYLQKEFNNDNQKPFYQKRDRLMRGNYCIDNLQSELLQCFLTDGDDAFMKACYKIKTEVQKATWEADKDLEKRKRRKQKTLTTQGTETN